MDLFKFYLDRNKVSTAIDAYVEGDRTLLNELLDDITLKLLVNQIQN